MDPFKNALSFLESVSSRLSEEDKPYLTRLHAPENLIKGEIEAGGKKYLAFRSQHNSALGPYKGGIRFHPNVSELEVKALALWMSIKCAVAGIPYGGSKGGVIVDPKTLSRKDLQALSRAYVRLIAKDIGPDRDIPAPDVNTNGQIMAWMLDEYEKIVGHKEPAAFTGKPLELGGSKGREEATGLGGVLVMESMIEALKSFKLKDLSFKQSKNQEPTTDNLQPSTYWYDKPKSQITIAVQGFGNVGYHFARIASKLGYRVVAVSDSKGAIYIEEGLDPISTMECKMEKGTLAGCYCKGGVCDIRGGKPYSNEALLELEVDILVPSALENVIHKENAANIKAKMVVEMANGPITPEADQILNERGILVMPDVYANSGGVTVSYLEWIQNKTGDYWEIDIIEKKLTEMMQKSFDSIWKRYERLKIESKDKANLRLSAYLVAVERIIAAERLRNP